MPQPKKRPSKAAKAAKKILEDSKLLANKAENEAKADQAFKPDETAVRTAEAIKPRPNKKRG
jgi:hypothetical protein